MKDKRKNKIFEKDEEMWKKKQRKKANKFDYKNKRSNEKQKLKDYYQ